MKKNNFLKTAVVIIAIIILFFLYNKKRKTGQPPVALGPYPDVPGGSGGGGGGGGNNGGSPPVPPVKTDPVIPSPIPRVKFKPPIPLGIDAIQPPEPEWRSKRAQTRPDSTLSLAIRAGFKFGTVPPTGDMNTINHLYEGARSKRSKIYDVSPYITWP